MQRQPMVDVLMPVYNGERYVARAIESLLGQTYRNIAIVIVEDGSTDRTLQVCEKYAAKNANIRLLHNAQNCGVAQSLNRGLELCDGEYVARMDSDDVSLPERIQKQVEYLEAHPEVGLLGTNAVCVNGANCARMYWETDGEKLKASMLFCTSMLHPSVMFRNHLVKCHHIRYPDRKAEDHIFFAALSEVAQVAALPDALLEYHREHNSICSTNAEVLRADGADSAREVIKRWLSIDVSGFPDSLFGLHPVVTDDWDAYVGQASRLHHLIRGANRKKGFIEANALEDQLRQRMSFARYTAGIGLLRKNPKEYGKDALTTLCNKLFHGGASVVVYGTGFAFSKNIEPVKAFFGLRIAAVTDSNAAKWGLTFSGYQAIAPAVAFEMQFDYCMIAAPTFQTEICDILTEQYHMPDDKILGLPDAELLPQIKPWFERLLYEQQ